MSKNNSSAPSLAALKMVGRKPVSGVKRGKSSSETDLVSRQIVSRRSSGVKSTGRNTARKTTTQTETLAAFKAIKPKTKIAKEDCDCIMVAIAIFCSSLVALDFLRIGPPIRPAALISPRILYTDGTATAALTPMTFIRGTKIRIRASVKPRRSSRRPMVTLMMIAIPMEPVI